MIFFYSSSFVFCIFVFYYRKVSKLRGILLITEGNERNDEMDRGTDRFGMAGLEWLITSI